MAKRGRPPKDEGSRKSVPLGVRVTPALREQLEARAVKSGRTLSQEMEARLRLSFGEPQRARDEFGGTFNYRLFHAMARGIRKIEERTGHRWFDDPYTFQQCTLLISEALSHFRPRGRTRVPSNLQGLQPGKSMATSIIAALELSLEVDLGPIAYDSLPVATKVKKSALKEVRRRLQTGANFLARMEQDIAADPEWGPKYSNPNLTLGEREDMEDAYLEQRQNRSHAPARTRGAKK